jgi:DNA-binding HxlR family transcriptional regulator
MSGKAYGLFCPISKACEVIEPRWTLQILAEMGGGATRFNEIRRGIPGISPSLLSKRLKEMEQQGLVEKSKNSATGTVDYVRTDRALELHPIMVALGEWAQRNIDPEIALCDKDARTLMWYVRRKINVGELPKKRNVMRFHFVDAPSGENRFWLVAKPGLPVDLCLSDPGHDVDLYIDTEVPILTGVLMGRCSLRGAIAQDLIRLSGARNLSRTIGKWLTLSRFAKTSGIVPIEEGKRGSV